MLPRKQAPEVGDVVFFHPALFTHSSKKHYNPSPTRQAQRLYAITEVDHLGTIYAAPLRIGRDRRTVELGLHDTLPLTVIQANRLNHGQAMPPDYIQGYVSISALEAEQFDLSRIRALAPEEVQNQS